MAIFTSPLFGSTNATQTYSSAPDPDPLVLVLNLGEFEDTRRWLDFYAELHPDCEVEVWNAYSYGCIDRLKPAAETMFPRNPVTVVYVLFDPWIPGHEDLAKVALSEWEINYPLAEIRWQHLRPLKGGIVS